MPSPATIQSEDAIALARRSERLWQIISAILVTVILAGGGILWDTRTELTAERLNREFIAQRVTTLEQTMTVYQANYISMGRDLTVMQGDVGHMANDLSDLKKAISTFPLVERR